MYAQGIRITTKRRFGFKTLFFLLYKINGTSPTPILCRNHPKKMNFRLECKFELHQNRLLVFCIEVIHRDAQQANRFL